jgi:choloylglycine hydrolase
MIMNATPIRRFFMLLGIIMLTLSMSPQAEPCSRVLWSDNGKAVVVGRNMDWVTPMPVNLYALPRGIKRNGMTGKNTLTWTAKYGTVVAESSDGMNEKGLAGHMLWLAESEYGAFDPNRPGLSVGLWLQYYLDNFATVKEAVDVRRQKGDGSSRVRRPERRLGGDRVYRRQTQGAPRQGIYGDDQLPSL